LAEIPGRPPRPAGLTLSHHVLISGVEAKQLTYLHNVHALASAPPWKSYKRTPTPPFQDTPFGEEKSLKQDVIHLTIIGRL
jgi:hypothetical protein